MALVGKNGVKIKRNVDIFFCFDTPKVINSLRCSSTTNRAKKGTWK